MRHFNLRYQMCHGADGLMSHMLWRNAARIIGLLMGLMTAPVWALPSTFNSTIGSALLCMDALDPGYFYTYLSQAFGAPYQHQGGAWWFKTPNTKLWNVQITSILVSDGRDGLLFIAAMSEVSTDKLAQAIFNNTGTRFTPGSSGKWPVLVSNTGSMIAWEKTKSKIYCAKDKRLFRLQP